MFSNLVRAQGRWNITAGQNSLFDTFDCQVHDFDSPRPNFLHGQLRWRIQKANGDFISRAGEQTFEQARSGSGCPSLLPGTLWQQICGKHICGSWMGCARLCQVLTPRLAPQHAPARWL